MKLRPNYLNDVNDARDCRDAISATKDFVRNHLFQLSDRETVKSYQSRLLITPNPPDTRIAFNRLLHSIRARIGDVYRESNLPEYINACNGVNGGIDGKGSTMISFISNKVLRELLTTRMVGVFCERKEAPATQADTAKPPKLKLIPIEAIANWVEDDEGNLIKLLLKTDMPKYEDEYIVSEETGYDEYILEDNVVTHRRLNASWAVIEESSTRMSQIPFAMIEIEESPVYTALEAHNALLQLSSSDYLFLNRSNYPIYTEQYNVSAQMQELQRKQFDQIERITDEDDKYVPKKQSDLETGTTTGVKYPAGVDRPGFIAPPTEHLRASETKQEKLRQQIEEIMSVDSLRVADKQQSADSKREEKETLVGNIQLLFDLFETFERKIASIYHEYFNAVNFKIEYPKTFDLRTESSRLKNAEQKLKIRDDISSITLKRLLTIEAVRDLMPTMNPRDLAIVQDEIMESNIHISLAKVVNLLDKGGIGITEAVTALGLSEEEADRIREDMEAKLKMIQYIQTGGQANTPGQGGQPEKVMDDMEDSSDES